MTNYEIFTVFLLRLLHELHYAYAFYYDTSHGEDSFGGRSYHFWEMEAAKRKKFKEFYEREITES